MRMSAEVGDLIGHPTRMGKSEEQSASAEHGAVLRGHETMIDTAMCKDLKYIVPSKKTKNKKEPVNSRTRHKA